MKPYWKTKDDSVRLYQGDVRDVLSKLPEQSVHCVVTSPPYWGLRDYGVDGQIGSEKSPDCLGWARGENCGECHVCVMRNVFREVHRVLRDDGTMWLNYGDSYNKNQEKGFHTNSLNGKGQKEQRKINAATKRIKAGPGPGNLVGVPWRLALALQADGWILRQDIIWAKPSPMPESVQNRCTKAHEYLFLLTKKPSKYYYDGEAIKDRSVDPESIGGRRRRKSRKDHKYKVSQNDKDFSGDRSGFLKGKANDEGRTYPERNKRSVWTVPSEAYPGAHFATFPRKLIEPCILAGCPEKSCSKCGTPWSRIVKRTKLTRDRPNDYVKRKGEKGTGNSCANSVAGVSSRTKGWKRQCKCKSSSVPGTVLDIFIGSGTTCEVAIRNNRFSIGIDINGDYLDNNAIVRVEGTLLDIPSKHGLVNRNVKKMPGGLL